MTIGAVNRFRKENERQNLSIPSNIEVTDTFISR